MHIDEFIDMKLGQECYARWMFLFFRLPAALKVDFEQFMEGHKLFCTYEDKRYRCTGASRLGDVWLTDDFEQDTGYQKRVDVDDCKDWGAEP